MFKFILKKINAPILKQLDRIEKPEYIKEIERAYRAGYDYHQKQIKSDPEMLSWITREQYMDEQSENQ